jgi:ureidoglycolate hydrolase
MIQVPESSWELSSQSSEPVFNFFIANHARATQKFPQVCEHVKMACSQVWTVGKMKKHPRQSKQVVPLCYQQYVGAHIVVQQNHSCWPLASSAVLDGMS